MAIKSRSRPINKIPFHFAKLSPLEQTSVKFVCRVSHSPVSAYKKWRRMEDCISIEAPGSPFLGTEEMFSRRRAWEAEAGAGSPGLELMVEAADTDSLDIKPSLNNLGTSFVLSPDWTNSIHV